MFKPPLKFWYPIFDILSMIIPYLFIFLKTSQKLKKFKILQKMKNFSLYLCFS
ncbi:hypothetical protein X275_07295 [Marinitoga sp. 1197]|nr:hypothetical protein X275_07295 [Marinitoga sp. 1197]